eukprot:4502748-Prymnesium_polylepis.1
MWQSQGECEANVSRRRSPTAPPPSRATRRPLLSLPAYAVRPDRRRPMARVAAWVHAAQLPE